LIWIGLCAGIILSVNAHPSSNEVPYAGLVILPEPGLLLTGRNQAEYKVGKLNSLDNAQVEHRFRLRNEAETPLAITNLETNCHCTTATVVEIAGHEPTSGEAFVYYLLPGQEMVIKVTVQLARQLSGPMSHGVAIYVSGYKSSIARLDITGEMEVGLTVVPSELDFDQMKIGETQSRTITITCDKRLLSEDELPRLESENLTAPGQQTGSMIKIVPQLQSTSANSVKLNSVMCVKIYQVIVQPNQEGALAARLFFASTRPTEYKGTISYDQAMAVFRELQVEVRGTVVKK
jgi:LEA14-like dessication related protein